MKKSMQPHAPISPEKNELLDTLQRDSFTYFVHKTNPGRKRLFLGSGWAASALIMPFAISLAVSGGSGIPICVAAVITEGTFGDVTSPVAGMTNMASNAVGADQVKYLKYASPYNFTALALAAIFFLSFGSIGGQKLKIMPRSRATTSFT